MQQNFAHKHKSQLIKTTEESKNRAKRKLIGSITMLLVALIVLLNVTSKVKPIPIKPQIITFKSKDSNKQVANNTNVNNNINANPNTNNSSQAIALAINNQSATNPNTQPLKTDSSQSVSTGINLANSSIAIKPRIINSSITKRPSPEDILNGSTEETVTIPRYYVQIGSSSNKEILQQIKQDLAEQDIKTSLQQIETPNGTIFRLRAGPFETHEDASNSLSDIIENVQTPSSQSDQEPEL